MTVDIRILRESVLPQRIPKTSFGPFRMMEAVPWLMVAAGLRYVEYIAPPILIIPFMLATSVAIFLAFLIAARRMIEFSAGKTELADLTFGQQVTMALQTISRVVPLLMAAAVVVFIAGQPKLAPHMFLGFDGIAFDQFTHVGRIWSSILACIVLLLIIHAGADREPDLGLAFRELFKRAMWLVPAILAVAVAHFALTWFQGVCRTGLGYFVNDPASNRTVKELLYFVFVFAFASVRLWITLAILTMFLRESYRREQ